MAKPSDKRQKEGAKTTVKWEDIAVKLLNTPASPKTPRKAAKKKQTKTKGR